MQIPRETRVVKDLLGRHPFWALAVSPQDKEQLVASIVNKKPGAARALGANYSLSDTGKAERGTVIMTDALNMHLSSPLTPAREKSLPQEGDLKFEKGFGGKLRNEEDLGLFDAIRNKLPKGKYYVHVEAGMKIWQLLKDLDACGLAVETMGAGGAQSLAGATATSTHGGDFNYSTLGDSIRAVHLVTPTGKEHWITPAGSPFAGAVRALRSHLERRYYMPKVHGNSPRAGLVQASPYIINTYDSLDRMFDTNSENAFRAAQVALGRLGVIYAMVLEVVPAYQLIEFNERTSWEEVRGSLSISHDYTRGLFDLPLDLRKFKAHKNYWTGNSQVSARAEDFRGSHEDQTSIPLHHLNLVLNLTSPKECWITRRWKTDWSDPAMAPNPGVAKHHFGPDATPSDLTKLLDRSKDRDFFEFLKELLHDQALLDRLYYSFNPEAAEDEEAARTVGATLKKILDYLLHEPSPMNFSIQKKLDDSINEVAGYVVASLGRATNSEKLKARDRIVKHEALVDSFMRALKVQLEEHRADGGERLMAMIMLIARGILSRDMEVDNWSEISKAMRSLKASILSDFIEVHLEEIGGKLKSSSQAPNTRQDLNARHRMWSYLKEFVNSVPYVSRYLVPNAIATLIFDLTEFRHPFRVGPATKILDTHDYSMDGHTSANSAEFFFDFNEFYESEEHQRTYVRFINEVLGMADLYRYDPGRQVAPDGVKDAPVFGYIGIRFMKRSEAWLAMQKYDRTVSVEVTTVRAERSDPYKRFRNKVFELAVKYGGIPHWGQEFGPEPTVNSFKNMLPKHYASRLADWRRIRDDFDPEGLFRTDFTKECGLEKS